MDTPPKQVRKQQEKLLAMVTAAVENLRKLHNNSMQRGLNSYCSYMQTWGAAPPLKGIVIGQSPYGKEEIIPSVSSAFAYNGVDVPASVDVIANTVAQNRDAVYATVVNGLKHSYCLLDSGFLFVDSRICSKQQTEEARKEACYQVACITQMLVLADMHKAGKIPVLCLGQDAQTMGAMIKASFSASSYRFMSASLDVLGCVHPAKVSRDFNRGELRDRVLDNENVVRELAKIPWTVTEGGVTWHHRQLTRHLELLTTPPFNLRKQVRNCKQAIQELMDNPQLTVGMTTSTQTILVPTALLVRSSSREPNGEKLVAVLRPTSRYKPESKDQPTDYIRTVITMKNLRVG